MEVSNLMGSGVRPEIKDATLTDDEVVARVMARIQGSDSGSSAGRQFSRD